MSSLVNCKVCQGKVSYFNNIKIDYSTISFNNPLYRCETCNFIFSPISTTQKSWYKDFLPDNEINDKDSVDIFMRDLILNEFRYSNLKNTSVIDYGCGQGNLIAELSNHPIFENKLNNFYGIDNDERRYKKNVEKSKFKKVKFLKNIPQKNTNSFLILSEVLEHFSDPLGFLINCRKLKIKKIFISVPNYGRKLRFLDQHFCDFPPAHLCFFDANSLSLIANNSGYSIKIINNLEVNFFKRAIYISKLVNANFAKLLKLRDPSRFFKDARNNKLVSMLIFSTVTIFFAPLIIILSLHQIDDRLYAIFD